MNVEARQRLKRLMDVFCALMLLVAFAPVMVWAAWAVYWDSPGPVIFRQTRVGLNGQPFVMLKFRTMRVGAEQEWVAPASPQELTSYVFQEAADARITRIGRYLRQHSIDELPQLINVLRGEMSLVGPRPEILEMVALYPPEANRRHAVRPGLTGLAQVSGRGVLTTAQTLDYDLVYCDTWTLKLDCAILRQTAGQLLRSTTAR
jgi:lipopolysaccharide/colanic/teichoic acid biosynthesis glycosyltransferase